MRNIILILLLLGYGSAAAHGLRYSVTDGEAVVIELFYAGGTAFSDKTYEIYREGENDPYQTGRTDRSGRIVFIPDRGGTWRIKAFSEDGHGLDITIEANVPGESADAGKAQADTLNGHLAMKREPVGTGARIIMALALIFGVFGVVSIFMRKKK
jgi:nickel transport protein